MFYEDNQLLSDVDLHNLARTRTWNLNYISTFQYVILLQRMKIKVDLYILLIS